jgi:hypothetical protein
MQKDKRSMGHSKHRKSGEVPVHGSVKADMERKDNQATVKHEPDMHDTIKDVFKKGV